MSNLEQFKARRRMKRILSSPISLVVLAIAVFFLARAAWGMYGKYQEAEARLSQSQSQLDALKAREDSLSASIASLSTASGTEAALRQNFRVVKPGESLAIIVRSATTGPATTTPGFWARIGGWFSRRF